MAARFDWKSIDFSHLPQTHEATIPEEFLDDMGHMNVMWYTHLFDQAVVGSFDLIGLDREIMRVNQAGGFALETHIKYLSEVRVGQTVKLYSRMLGRSDKRFHILHFMFNESKQNLAATFEVIGAYIDMKGRRMADWPTQIAQKLDAIISRHNELRWPAPVCGVMEP